MEVFPTITRNVVNEACSYVVEFDICRVREPRARAAGGAHITRSNEFRLCAQDNAGAS